MTERERQLMDDFDLFEMGVLGAAESAEMRRALAESDELRAAFLSRDASDLLLGYSLREDVPSRDARDNFMREMRHSQPAQLQIKSAPASRVRLWAWPAWTFAALTVLLAAALVIVMFQNAEYRQTNQLQSAQIGSQQQQLAQVQTQAAAQAKTNAMMAVMQAPDTAHFVLTASTAKPQPQIKAFCRRSTGQVVLMASNLPPVSAEKAYELWMIPADGEAPMPAGMFRPDAQGNVALTMTQTAANHPAKLFAVTVEPANGSPAPTSAIVFSGAQGG